jgi:hypothetical protein
VVLGQYGLFLTLSLSLSLTLSLSLPPSRARAHARSISGTCVCANEWRGSWAVWSLSCRRSRGLCPCRVYLPPCASRSRSRARSLARARSRARSLTHTHTDPDMYGYALTGCAECALALRPNDGGVEEAQDLLSRALEPPSDLSMEVKGVGGYRHYPRALTLLARIKLQHATMPQKSSI